MDEQEPVEYDLVEPFIVCASQGGRYDDESFVAGVQYAHIEADLRIGAPEETYSVPPSLVPQVDLTAMRHGYTTTAEPWEDGQDWVIVRVTEMQRV